MSLGEKVFSRSHESPSWVLVRFQYCDDFTIERPFKFVRRSEWIDCDLIETGNEHTV